MRIVIAAAGTGGHVYPALAVAEALVERGLDRSAVVFFGGDRIEAAEVPGAGFPFRAFPLARLRRSASLSNLAIPVVVQRTVRAMASAIDEIGACAVLGMGGYATVPAAMAARRRRIRFVLHEQNASPGLASRFSARYAEAALLGLPGASERLPRSRLVGNPLRRAFAGFERAAAREEGRIRYQVPEGHAVVGVLGGSLGARILNESVAPILAAARGRSLAVVHLTGPAAFEEIRQRSNASGLPWRCLSSEDRMDLFYGAADLVVSRSGAMTVSELAATRTPAVLVPLEAVGQQGNATAMAAAGGAVVLLQRDAEHLPALVADLTGDPDRLEEMAGRAATLARPEAAEAVADVVVGGRHG